VTLRATPRAEPAAARDLILNAVAFLRRAQVKILNAHVHEHTNESVVVSFRLHPCFIPPGKTGEIVFIPLIRVRRRRERVLRPFLGRLILLNLK
jgi:hypothetical protein